MKLAFVLLVFVISTAASANCKISVDNQYFVATRRGKILWTWPIRSDGSGAGISILKYDRRTGISILESEDEILLVDSLGRIRKRLNVQSDSAPRILLLTRDSIVYDAGAVRIADYDPKSEGKQLYSWLCQVRRVHAFDLKTMKQLWAAPTLDAGLPICSSNGCLTTIAISNIADCISDPEAKPIVEVKMVDVQTGRTLKLAVLSLSKVDSRSIMKDVLDFEPIAASNANWCLTTVKVINLFGFSCVGPIRRS